jgi:cytochrome oxidase assembly protein ShyY1
MSAISTRPNTAVLRSPKWVAGHLLALTLVALFVNLGLWQLRRLAEVRDHNAVVAQRTEAEARPFATLAGGVPVDELAYRRTVASGHYVTGEQVRTAPRSRDGRPGQHILTPLALADGTALLVDRGWVPLIGDEPVPPTVDPPDGAVTVTGLLLPSETPFRFGPKLAEDGRLEVAGRIDLARLDQQTELPLHGVYLQLHRQAPPQPAGVPLAGTPPELSERNHLAYAVQWFLFALVGVVGYPLLLRRVSAPPDAAAAP